MFEDTNQTETPRWDSTANPEATESFGEKELFADYEPEDTDEGGAADEEESTVDAAGGENQAVERENTPDKYKVVFNGQELELTLDELRTHAQKGLNYDHVYDQLQRLKKSPAIDLFEQYAKRNGMNVDEYAEYLQRLENQQRVNAMAQEGIPETAAQRILELEERESARTAREAEEQKRAAMQKQYMDFLREYPDLAVSDIPQEVWERVEKGMELTAAYALYENKTLKTKVKQQEQNEVNRKKAVGPIKSENADGNTDAFLQGLFG